MCIVDDCDGQVVARGWCRKHYQRWWQHGDTEVTLRRYFDRAMSLEDRLLVDRIVDEVTGCWNWGGATTRGYGIIDWQGFDSYVHRAAYSVWIGPIPDNMLVRHKCDNRKCINPKHLEVGTHLDNMQDMRDRRRSQIGERNTQSKLTEESVITMRKLYGAGTSQSTLGKMFGVSQTVAGKAVRGITWSHVQM